MSKTKVKTTERKRHGQHRKHTHHYKKVYWPYLPMLVALFFVLALGTVQPKSLGNVLGFASQIEHESLLEATNEQRLKNDIEPLALNPRLNQAAQLKAEDMMRRNYWSHQTPEGDQPWVFIDEVDYTYQKAGENLAYGFLSSNATVSGWMNSASHRENLLRQDYTEVGFGIVNAEDYLNKDDETIVVAFYATPAQLSLKADGVQSVEASSEEQQFGSPKTPFSSTASIPFVATLTEGNAPWLSFLVGTTLGGAAVFLIVRHGIRLKRMVRQGELFVMHHPVLDLTVTIVIVAAVLLSQSVGFVL